MKITIIGAGNGGLTSAYWIAKNKHEVCLVDVPEFATHINKIKKTSKITALKSFDGIKMINGGIAEGIKATTNFEEGANFSDIIIMICPSFAQEILFNKLLPFLKDGHKIVLLPGNYGGMVLNKIKNVSKYKNLKLTFVDGITIPFACRITDLAEISILGVKKHISASVFSNNNSTDILSKLSIAFGLEIKKLDNPIIAGLENFNFGGHPIMTVCNIGLLENFNGNFNYYKDCCSPAIANAIEIMDQERMGVGNKLGYKLLSDIDASNSLYGTSYKTSLEFNRASSIHAKLNNAPNSSKNRYITEDVPFLLVPCYFLAKKANIEVPIVESIIRLASAYNKTDYFKTGRTLIDMGLDEMSLSEIKNLFKGKR